MSPRGASPPAAPRVFVVDNYDSFTYNLVQHLAQMGAHLEVHRNDVVSVADVAQAAPDYIVLSPGPKRPEHAGISVALIRALGDRIPILGVCLGHQCIGQAFGARIAKDRRVFHGKTSSVRHDGETVFDRLDNPLTAARYHSLVVDPDGLPDCLLVSARTEDGVIMGLRHARHPIEGLQFHPESFLTPAGFALLRNFLRFYAPARRASWRKAP